MQMTEFEILKEYREAKDMKEQVKILADCNLCDVWDMVVFFKEHGADINLRWFQNLNPNRAEVNKKMGIPMKKDRIGQVRTGQDRTRQEHEQVSNTIGGMFDIIRVFVAGLSGMQAWLYGELLRAVFALQTSIDRETFDQVHDLLRMIEEETEARRS